MTKAERRLRYHKIRAHALKARGLCIACAREPAFKAGRCASCRTAHIRSTFGRVSGDTRYLTCRNCGALAPQEYGECFLCWTPLKSAVTAPARLEEIKR